MEKKTSLFKVAVGKLISGFLLGIGFTVAMVLIGGFAANSFKKSIEEDMPMEFKKFDETSGLEVLAHSDESTPERLIVIGQIKNNSDLTWEMVEVEVELFKEGKFLRECSDYVNGKIGPEKTENFMVDCGGCNNYILPNYDKYTVEIKSAH